MSSRDRVAMATLVLDLRIHPFVVPTTIFLDVTHRGLVLALWHVRESEDITVLGSIWWPHQLTLRWQLHKEAAPREVTVFAFGNNLSPTNLLTLCKNDVLHNMMSNALLLITQQRHRRKNSKQPGRGMCACVCYTEACATVYVCASCRRSMLAEDAGSSAGKVN